MSLGHKEKVYNIRVTNVSGGRSCRVWRDEFLLCCFEYPALQPAASSGYRGGKVDLDKLSTYRTRCRRIIPAQSAQKHTMRAMDLEAAVHQTHGDVLEHWDPDIRIEKVTRVLPTNVNRAGAHHDRLPDIGLSIRTFMSTGAATEHALESTLDIAIQRQYLNCTARVEPSMVAFWESEKQNAIWRQLSSRE